MKKFAFAFILIFTAYSLFSQTSAENEITESEVTESEENKNSLAKIQNGRTLSVFASVQWNEAICQADDFVWI